MAGWWWLGSCAGSAVVTNEKGDGIGFGEDGHQKFSGTRLFLFIASMRDRHDPIPTHGGFSLSFYADCSFDAIAKYF